MCCGNKEVDGRTVKKHAEEMARGNRKRAPAPGHSMVPPEEELEHVAVREESDADEEELDPVAEMNAFCQEIVELVAEGTLTQMGAEAMLKVTHHRLQPALPEDYVVPCSWYKCRTSAGKTIPAIVHFERHFCSNKVTKLVGTK